MSAIGRAYATTRHFIITPRDMSLSLLAILKHDIIAIARREPLALVTLLRCYAATFSSARPAPCRRQRIRYHAATEGCRSATDGFTFTRRYAATTSLATGMMMHTVTLRAACYRGCRSSPCASSSWHEQDCHNTASPSAATSSSNIIMLCARLSSPAAASRRCNSCVFATSETSTAWRCRQFRRH